MSDLPDPAQEIRDLRRDRDEWRRECEKCSEKLAAAKEENERLRRALRVIGLGEHHDKFGTVHEAHNMVQVAKYELNKDTTTDP